MRREITVWARAGQMVKGWNERSRFKFRILKCSCEDAAAARKPRSMSHVHKQLFVRFAVWSFACFFFFFPLRRKVLPVQ